MTIRALILSAISVGCMAQPLAGQVTAEIRTDLAPKVIEADEGERRDLSDGRHILLKVGPENSGASYLFMGTEDLPPGTSIPRHRHEVDEEILIVHHGEITIELDDVPHRAGEGAVVFLPPRTWISLRNESEDVATIMFVFPRGSVERCFQFIGSSERGEVDPVEAVRAEERRSCLMTYRPR